MKYITAALIALILGFVTYLMGTFTATIYHEFTGQPDNLGLFMGLLMMASVTGSLLIGTVCLVWMEIYE